MSKTPLILGAAVAGGYLLSKRGEGRGQRAGRWHLDSGTGEDWTLYSPEGWQVAYVFKQEELRSGHEALNTPWMWESADGSRGDDDDPEMGWWSAQQAKADYERRRGGRARGRRADRKDEVWADGKLVYAGDDWREAKARYLFYTEKAPGKGWETGWARIPRKGSHVIWLQKAPHSPGGVEGPGWHPVKRAGDLSAGLLKKHPSGEGFIYAPTRRSMHGSPEQQRAMWKQQGPSGRRAPRGQRCCGDKREKELLAEIKTLKKGRAARGRRTSEMETTTVDGKMVKVGDWVGFKSDTEQYGQIVGISREQTWGGPEVRLTLKNDAGFSGDYIGGDHITTVPADDCWV